MGKYDAVIVARLQSDEQTDETTDPVVDALERVIQLALGGPQPNHLMVGSIRQAIDAYRSHRLGTGEPGPSSARRGLTLWQERRAKKLLAEKVGDEHSIAEIAAACKLSRSYFIRAFKAATGETPHRWLLQHRIQMAKELLLGPLPISEIALACGFSDQSHLTRVFSGLIGMPPGAWRRDYESVVGPASDRSGDRDADIQDLAARFVPSTRAYRSQMGGAPMYS